jgi:predicted nucleotidyltransferase
MASTINIKYKDFAVEFAKRAVTKLGNKIDAILLYGSVSRGEAKKTSDIDLLIITNYAHNSVFKDKIYTIATDFEYENDFSFFLSMVFVTPNELAKQVALRVPFIENVREDAVRLYGKWLFSKID